MGKDIGQIYKHSQSQLSTFSIKSPVSAPSESQTSSAIKLITAYVPSTIDKHQNNSVFYSQNTIHNDETITNNDNIHSCETPKKFITFQPFQQLIIIQNVLLPHHKVDLIITHLRYYLQLVNNICVL